MCNNTPHDKANTMTLFRPRHRATYTETQIGLFASVTLLNFIN